jgi:hypothetical protein
MPIQTMASVPSKELWDGLTEMMLPLDAQGYSAIVVTMRRRLRRASASGAPRR